jgi:hypothetical protein
MQWRQSDRRADSEAPAFVYWHTLTTCVVAAATTEHEFQLGTWRAACTQADQASFSSNSLAMGLHGS